MRAIPHDDRDFAYTLNALRVGLGGTVRLKTYDGVVRTITAAAGTVINLPVRRIYRTGTTAGEFWTDMLGQADRTPVPYAGVFDEPGPQPGPTAYFSFTPDGGDSETVIAFTDESIDTPTAWLWERNSGSGWSTFSTSQNPSMTFADGTWSIRLTVTNAYGSDTDTQTDAFVVFTPIDASFTTTELPTPFYDGDTISFTDTSTGTPTSWLWERDSGSGYSSFSTSQNPANVVFAAGTWSVRLTAGKVGSVDSVTETNLVVALATPVAGTFTSGGGWSDKGQLKPSLDSDGTISYSESAPARWTRRIEYQVSHDSGSSWTDAAEWVNPVGADLVAGTFANVVEDLTTYPDFLARFRVALSLSGHDDVLGDWQNISNTDVSEIVSVNATPLTIDQFGGMDWTYTRTQINVTSVSFSIDPATFGTVNAVSWRGYHEYTGNEYTDTVEVGPSSGFSLTIDTPVEYEDVIHLYATPIRSVSGPSGETVPHPATEFEAFSDFASTPTIAYVNQAFGGTVLPDSAMSITTEWSVTPGRFVGGQMTLRWFYDANPGGDTTLFTALVDCSASYDMGEGKLSHLYEFTATSDMFWDRAFTGGYDFGLGGGYTDIWGLVTPPQPLG